MSGYEDLERQLRAGVARGRRRRILSAAGVVLSGVIVVTLAVFAVVALGHHGLVRHPGPTGLPHHQLQELNFINAADQSVFRHDPACLPGPGPNPRGPRVDYGTPSSMMLSVLGVLRRPATSADRLPARFYRRGHLFPGFFARDVYIRYIRRARVKDGVSYYVIPVARVGEPAPPLAVLNRCYADEMRALRRQPIPGSLRRSTLAFGAVLFGRTRANRAHSTVHEGVFEMGFRGGGGAGGGGASPAEIAQQGTIGTDGPVVHGVVPSGVVAVTLEFPVSGTGRQRLRALNVATDVVGNVFAVSVPRANGGHFPAKMIWWSAQGRVIKIVRLPF